MNTQTAREKIAEVQPSQTPFQSRLRMPALAEMAKAENANFFLQFGGQAAGYIDELRSLYQQYPLVRPLIESAAMALGEESSHKEALKSGFFNWGISLLDWIKTPETTPPLNYLASSVISQPLIFITQMAHYVQCLSYGFDAEILLDHTKGTTGHSQGIMAAVLVALKPSHEVFHQTFEKMVRYFFWQGVRMQACFPEFSLPQSLIEECQKKSWGYPSPMASLTGMTPNEITPVLDAINNNLPTTRHISVSLINGLKRLVLSGSPEGLIFLRRQLEKMEAHEKKKSYSSFKIRWEFLAVTGAYHCPHMAPGLELFRNDVARIGLTIASSDLKIPVYATNDGRDLSQSKNLMEELMQLQFVQPVDWSKATARANAKNGITHVVDFGPGEMASTLTFINREGEGIVVIPFASSRGKDELFSTDAKKNRRAETMWTDYAPTLAQLPDQTLVLDNHYVRYTGRPPIFSGGMTPTTVETDIVIAAANEGYLVEWAGGGQVTEAILRKRLDEIVAGLKPGRGIIFNALYLDAYLWNLHYPLFSRLKNEGYPIEGVTISAGIPTREKAAEILKNLNDNGIWCNSFKPGSDDQIKSVLEIAQDHPQYTIIMQIEGGKAGGHHSWEDLYGLIERNYAAIRRRKNVILCVGGGISDEETAWQWLSGTWHESGKLMPADAVFLGTRLMACKEAKTSPQVKELLVKISGTKNWVERGQFDGGVTSGQSQLGADVHYADNTMSRVAHFIDQISTKNENEIWTAKNEIIKNLNKTAKPYFGDLQTMTYAQVLTRLVDLMAPGHMPEYFIHDEPWFDTSYRERALDFILRTIARLCEKVPARAELPTLADLNNPKMYLEHFFRIFPQAQTTQLHPEDVDFFLSLCRKPGKPVNFVPVIDKSIKRWFKSDSLWQAHDPRYSADQVLAIPGILAVKDIQKINEPVATIFSNFVSVSCNHLKKMSPSSLFQIAALGTSPTTGKSNVGKNEVEIRKGKDDYQTEFVIVDEKIDLKLWIETLASSGTGAISALLKSRFIVAGKNKRDNFITQLLFPRKQATANLEIIGNRINMLLYTDANGLPLVEIRTKSEGTKESEIILTLTHRSADDQIHSVNLEFSYHPHDAQAAIVLDTQSAQKNISALYQKLWLGTEAKQESKASSIWNEFQNEVPITREMANSFATATRDQSLDLAYGAASSTLSIMLLWKPLSRCLFQDGLTVEFLHLLHLSNEFVVHSSETLTVGELLQASVRLTGIKNEKLGTTLTIEGKLIRDDKCVITLTSRFFIRVPADKLEPASENHFCDSGRIQMSPLVLTRLKSKSWFVSKALIEENTVLDFKLSGFDRSSQKGLFDYQTRGILSLNQKIVAEIILDENKSKNLKNPARYFFNHHQTLATAESAQKSGQSFSETFLSPQDNSVYSVASCDLNPIHTDAHFAALAGLPINTTGQATTIVHGMWTAAATLNVLRKHIPEQVIAWKTDFVGMVAPNSQLTVNAQHSANRDGHRVFQVKTTDSLGNLVVSGEAIIAQPKTAYLFTGQGSQATGMGMAAYNSSETARGIWDTAEQFCQNELGFSILKIVRDNPKEIYVAGERVTHPSGVLNLTQFAQVGLTVLAMAQIAELKAAGIYSKQAFFAGHSLGEYAALSCSGIIPLHQVIRVVYHRGLTMQNFVPRDENGKSPYGMIVVRPNTVKMTEAQLAELITSIAEKSDSKELYLVNYNIEGSQYSVTGRQELFSKLMFEMKELEKKQGSKKSSCIVIEGVDVPFHSAVLTPGVSAFRKTLENTIPQSFDPAILTGHYIPNLNAELFCLDKDYVEGVFKLTQSPVLEKVLASWKEWQKDQQRLARTLLIELLAYQFASPVQWIRTQKLLLKGGLHGVTRVIEVGPSAVLTNMFKATLTREAVALIPSAFHMDTDRDAVFYVVAQECENEINASVVESISTAPLPTQSSVPAIHSTIAVSTPTDKAFSMTQGLKALIALKLNLRCDEIRDNETLEALSGGNSARRNEILSDIGAEFQIGAIDEAHLLSIEKLVETLDKKANYTVPGTFLQKAIDRAIKEKLSLTKKEILEHLSGERMLPPGLSQSVLTQIPLAVRTTASARSGALSTNGITERLADRNAAFEWLNKVIDEFAATAGFSAPYRSQSASGGSSGVSEEALKHFEEKYFGKNSPFTNWAADLLELTGNSTQAISQPDFSEELASLKLYQEAFGPAAQKVATPIFSEKKRVSFTSAWNWSRRDLISLTWNKINSCTLLTSAEMANLSRRCTKDDAAIASYLAKVATQHKRDELAKQLSSLESNVANRTNQNTYAPVIASYKPEVKINPEGQIQYTESERHGTHNTSAFIRELIAQDYLTGKPETLKAIENTAQNGFAFANKVFLVTGASPGSIAWETLHYLISAGAKVIATTSSYNDERVHSFRKLYQQNAVAGAELHLFPMSQGSQTDIDTLVNWCFANRLIPDYLLPFGAIGESATLTMMNADASTATLRVLLQGVEWLIAAIAKNLRAIHAQGKSCLTVLPLSPNHGNFGGDGAYADAKIGLECLLNRWHAEKSDWGRYITLVGAKIGWVRGTGLMLANNILATAMEEKAGVRTFSTQEAGYLITALCHEDIVEMSRTRPVEVGFTGGFETVSDLATLATNSRLELENKSKLMREIIKDESDEKSVLKGTTKESKSLTKKSSVQATFPNLPKIERLKKIELQKNLTPENITVVVGYGEVSPFGSSAPRFEIECNALSQAGAIEIAWIMNLIRYENGTGKSPYVGWVDAKTGKPVSDDSIWNLYGKTIQEGTGVRFADPETQKFDPRQTIVFGDIVLESPLSFVVENAAQAQTYVNQYGEAVKLVTDNDGQMRVSIAKGSVIKVPRRIELSRFVAGQVPKGWEATRFGVPKELATQVDRTTLYNMVSSAQAFATAGIDPEELATHIHPTLIGNSQGGGMGGMTALNRMYHDHREDKQRQGDTLQETLINVGPAWVNQSYVGGYGPTVNPVAACATALVSLSVGCDLIAQGKAEFVVTGGYDDYSEEGIIGFQDMAATCDTKEMLARGIAPHAMSRPNDSRRAGFVEAQGGGTLLLTNLKRAVEMGLPVYAVLAFASNYSDGVHTSIPAPGLGLLGMAKEGINSPLAKSLAQFGLNADDITVVSKHDTSTAANDPNENKLHHTVQQHLGRTPGNPLLVHSQKALLGHAKGGAGAWQAIASLQMLTSGKIPGNKNLEDVDSAMQAYSTLSFSDETIEIGPDSMNAVLMTSLGFGHVGAVSLFLHPRYALAALGEKEYADYCEKRMMREKKSVERHENVLLEKEMLFAARKERLTAENEMKLLLN